MCVFPFWNGKPWILGVPIFRLFSEVFFPKPNRLLFLEKSQQNPGRKPQASVWYHPTSGTNSPVFSHGRFTADRLLTPPFKRNEWMNSSPLKRDQDSKGKFICTNYPFSGDMVLSLLGIVSIYIYIVDYCGMRAKVNGSPINYNIQW